VRRDTMKTIPRGSAKQRETSIAKGETMPRPCDKKNTVKLAGLRLNDSNPRRISKEAFAKLCASVKAFPKMMTVRGIVVDKDGIIIGGTQRYRACVANGMKEVPASWVKRAEDFTAEERRRFIIADNAPEGIAGEWDMDLLANEWDMAELLAAGFEEEDLLGANIDRPELVEESETLRYKKMIRVLISVPIEKAGEAKPLIDACLSVEGVEVIQGAN
jgi:hypothetical protein